MGGLLKAIPIGGSAILLLALLYVVFWQEAVMLTGAFIAIVVVISNVVPKGYWSHGGRTGVRKIGMPIILLMLAVFLAWSHPWRFLAAIQTGELTWGWVIFLVVPAFLLLLFLGRRRLWVWIKWGLLEALFGHDPNYRVYVNEAKAPADPPRATGWADAMWDGRELPPHSQLALPHARGTCRVCGRKCRPDHDLCYRCWRQGE